MDTISHYFEDYLSALLEGDYAVCSEIVESLLEANVEIRLLYEDLFQRSLYEVGVLWENAVISVTTEHLATATTEALLTLVYPKVFSADHIDRTVIVCCSSNEYHQLGGRMVADFFELHHWHAHFLGAKTSTSDLFRFIRDKNPHCLALSVAISSNIPKTEELIRTLRAENIAVPVLLGGYAFQNQDPFPSIHKLQNVQIIRTLAMLEDFIVKHA